MVAKASNFAATGQGWLLTQYVVAYSLFLIGACISGMLINYETFYLGRNYGRALFMVRAGHTRVGAARPVCMHTYRYRLVDPTLNPTNRPQIAAVQSVALLTENVYDEYVRPAFSYAPCSMACTLAPHTPRAINRPPPTIHIMMCILTNIPHPDPPTHPQLHRLRLALLLQLRPPERAHVQVQRERRPDDALDGRHHRLGA